MKKSSQKNRPIIGITTYGRNEHGQFHLYAQYVDAVRRAGGLAILLPPGDDEPEETLEIIDGLILAGGGDIDPQLYEGNHHAYIEHVDAERDRFEQSLALAVVERWPKPVLGICRGQQMLNIVTGGTLIEHLPDVYGNKMVHRSAEKREVLHPVEIDSSSRLAEIIGSEKIEVKSLHHQAIGEVTAVWEITARSADGVIEAQEHRKHPWILAVQWHPELSPDDERHRRLFRAFVEAAKG